MSSVRAPKPLDISYGVNAAEAWIEWKRKFTVYLMGADLRKKDDDVKVGALLSAIGDDGHDIYDSFDYAPAIAAVGGANGVAAENPEHYDTVIKKFDEHFKARDGRLKARRYFHFQMKREPTQSFAQWVNTVKRAAKKCQFSKTDHDARVRDVIVGSVTDNDTLDKLMEINFDELTLQKAIAIISVREESIADNARSGTTSIKAVSKKPQKSRNTPTKSSGGKLIQCRYCGKKHAPGRKDVCPAYKSKCSVCDRTGHYAAVCWHNKKNVHAVEAKDDAEDTNPSSDDEHSLPDLSCDMVSLHPKSPGIVEWTIKLGVASDELTWVFDSGAQVSVMPKALYKKAYGNLHRADITLLGANRTPLTILGYANMLLTSNARKFKEKVYIAEETVTPLLGSTAIHQLGTLSGCKDLEATIKAVESTPTASLRTKEEVKSAYPELFQGIGKLKEPYTIQLKENARPFSMNAPRNIPIRRIYKLEKGITKPKRGYSLMQHLPSSDKHIEEIRQELTTDENLRTIMNYVLTEWPKDKKTLLGPLRKYWDVRALLTVHDNLLLKSNRLVIPPTLRKDMLERLHKAHLGITKTRQLAAQACWWPGLSKDIEQTVRNCNRCEEHRRDRIEPMMGTEFPARPWSRIAADFFQLGSRYYLLVVDYHSRDVELCQVTTSIGTRETITKFKKIFSRHGICDTLITDNARVFTSTEFSQFSKSWNFEHLTSSPRYPQSNGMAERTVSTIKNLLKKSDDIYLTLLTYRNTPLQNGYSPAQLSLGRRLKTNIPCHPDQLLPETVDRTTLREREREYRKKMTQNYNKRHRVVDSDDFDIGNHVYIPDCETKGKVVDIDENPRSIIVETGNGLLRRNRRKLRKYKSPEEVETPTPVIDEPDLHHYFNTSEPSNTTPPTQDLRRSSRPRKPPRRLIEQCG